MRFPAAVALWGLLAASLASADEAKPVPAVPARLAASSLLLDIAAAGSRLVVVGERGHVLFSDDRGTSWTQAASVPTQTLLTAVCFSDDRHGVAVGHDETILTTEDAGNTWTLRQYRPQAQQPLLDVWCGEAGRAIAVGAYSSYYVSADGGATWNARAFAAQPLAASSALSAAPGSEPAPGSQPAESAVRGAAASSASAEQSDYGFEDIPLDYHLNRIVQASPSRFYIAAEAGHLFRSEDGGQSWIELPSPYEGSFFGVLPLDGDALLAYGMRGNLYRSSDAGASWRQIETGTLALLNDAVRWEDGRIAIVGLSGVVLVSADDARTFQLVQLPDRKGISAAWPVAPGRLATAGENGARVIALPGGAAQ